MTDFNPEIKVALTGDSIIARKISVYQDEQTQKLYDLLKKADIAFTNLEVLPNDFRGYPAARSDGAHFAANSYVLDDLKELGFNLYSCANNHALDYGVEGLLTTIDELKKRDLSFAGIGKNLTESRMPVYHEVKGGTVAMISCTSTFFDEQAAGEARPEVQGRPGVNPLAFDVEYEVTEQQMLALKDIYEGLGLESNRKEFVELGFGKDPEDERISHFFDSNLRTAGTLNANFRISDKPKTVTKPNERDIVEICGWIREAKSRADVVIVSLHAHEQETNREEPAEFIREFAHRAIEAGADVLVGHGPHLLRGIELYQGKPIFYSLGNFIGHNELIYKLPEDSYKRFKIESSLKTSEIFRIRSDNGKKGFPGNELYWQTIVPVCAFSEGKLTSIELIPVSLTKGDVPHHRGRPYLADQDKGEAILKKLDELSAAYGTKIVFDENGIGNIELLVEV